MGINVNVEGVEALRANLRRLEQQARRRLIREATHTAAVDLSSDIIRKINGAPATGRPRPVRRNKKGKVTGGGGFASAAGEYPMTDTATLVSMIDVERTNNGAAVISRAEYSAALEKKPAAEGGRPFMSRGLQENEQRIHAVVNWAAIQLFGI